MNQIDRDRYKGCLLGLAVGDAVGTTLEFKTPGTFTPITDMVGGGPFHLQPGQWTDDTSMALCLAQSLIIHDGEFEPGDIMDRFCHWRDRGYMSSTGRCFDIGGTCSGALSRYRQTGNPVAGLPDKWQAGNGALMRLAPIPMAFRNMDDAVLYSGFQSELTHGALESIEACAWYGSLIRNALDGAPKAHLLLPSYPYLIDTAAILDIHRGSYLGNNPPLIRGTGYVVKALEAAMWAFSRAKDFEEAVLLAANLGDDADTTAAIVGQLAGAHWGIQGIPDRWLRKLHMRDAIEEMAECIFNISNQRPL